MFAYDYPLLSVFWSLAMVFLFVAWIFLLFRIIGDIFRRDSSGWSKALWSLFVIVAPLLGTFLYVIVHGHGMITREVTAANERQAAFDTYVRQVAGGSVSAADEIEKLASLRDRGVLTDDEFAAQKARLLAAR